MSVQEPVDGALDAHVEGMEDGGDRHGPDEPDDGVGGAGQAAEPADDGDVDQRRAREQRRPDQGAVEDDVDAEQPVADDRDADGEGHGEGGHER